MLIGLLFSIVLFFMIIGLRWIEKLIIGKIQQEHYSFIYLNSELKKTQKPMRTEDKIFIFKSLFLLNYTLLIGIGLILILNN